MPQQCGFAVLVRSTQPPAHPLVGKEPPQGPERRKQPPDMGGLTRKASSFAGLGVERSLPGGVGSIAVSNHLRVRADGTRCRVGGYPLHVPVSLGRRRQYRRVAGLGLVHRFRELGARFELHVVRQLRCPT